MRVEWSSLAEESWREIAEYIYGEFGAVALMDYSEQTDSWVDALARNPKIAKLEERLSHRSKEYRSVSIHKLSKLVFYVEEDVLRIADVWDTRKNPSSLTRRLS